MNRRQFLRQVEGLSAGALAAGAAGAALPLGGCIGFHYVTSTLAGNRLVIRRAEFGAGRFVLVDAPGEPLPLYVYRQDDGSFSAVSTRCMHRGCQVEPAAGHLVCPCHGSEYTNDGGVVKGPTQEPLRRFPVFVEGDEIMIEIRAPGSTRER